LKYRTEFGDESNWQASQHSSQAHESSGLGPRSSPLELLDELWELLLEELCELLLDELGELLLEELGELLLDELSELLLEELSELLLEELSLDSSSPGD
jgi:hypothetical protein